MALVRGANQLHGDAYTPALMPGAALDEIIRPQFPRYFRHAFSRSFEAHHGGACDDTQLARRKAAKLGDELFGEAIAEILPLRVAAEVFEREDSQHGPFTKLLLFRAGFARSHRQGDEAVALSRHGLKESRAGGAISECLTDFPNGRVQPGLGLDENFFAPHAFDRLFMRDEFSGTLREEEEEFERGAVEPDAPARAPQFEVFRIQFKRGETENPGRHVTPL